MKKIILISLLLHSIWAISQNNISSKKYYNCIAKDSIMQFPVWRIKNEKLFLIFDNIIEKNNKCLKNKKWESIGDNYFFEIKISNYPDIEDTNYTYQISINSVINFDNIKTFTAMNHIQDTNFHYYCGLILHKNKVFMIVNNPKEMNNVPFFFKTNAFYDLNYANQTHFINIFPRYVLNYKILFRDGDFKIIKKSGCP